MAFMLASADTAPNEAHRLGKSGVIAISGGLSSLKTWVMELGHESCEAVKKMWEATFFGVGIACFLGQRRPEKAVLPTNKFAASFNPNDNRTTFDVDQVTDAGYGVHDIMN